MQCKPSQQMHTETAFNCIFITVIYCLSINYNLLQTAMISDDEESLSELQMSALSSSVYDHLAPKEDMKTTKDFEQFYTPLGRQDLGDLPSFAYQISNGMVSGTKCEMRNYDSCFHLRYSFHKWDMQIEQSLPSKSTGVPLLPGYSPPRPGLPQHPGG